MSSGDRTAVVAGSLERQFGVLERQREALQSRLSQLTPAQLSFRPAEGAWTIPEVVHHLALTERAILAAATKPDVRRSGRTASMIGRSLLWGVLKFGIRVSVPVPQLRPQRGISLDDAHNEWLEARQRWREFLPTLPHERLHEMAFRHPIAGPVRYARVLDFLRRHCAHHVRQINRIQTHPAFPQLPVTLNR